MDHSSISLNTTLVLIWQKMTVQWQLAKLPSQKILSSLYTLQADKIFKSFKGEQKRRSENDDCKED